MKEEQMDMFKALMEAAGTLHAASLRIQRAHDLVIDIANSETKKIHDRFTPEEISRYEQLQKAIKADQLADFEQEGVE
jgi:CO/xanthine dehydrogenase Mo-binding subunit